MNLLKRDQPLIAAVRNNKLDDHIKTAAALHWPKDNALTDRLLLKPINKMGRAGYNAGGAPCTSV
jgi:hypothetical protein